MIRQEPLNHNNTSTNADNKPIQEACTDTQAKKPREYKSIQPIEQGTVKHKSVRLNAKLHNLLAEIANERRRGFSNTARLLLYLGIEQYRLNQLSGNNTVAKRQQHKAKQEAEAMAKAAERERRKNLKKSDTITAVTPMLFRPDDEE